jgi:hypothetical protein
MEHFYGEGLLASHTNPKLEDNPLSTYSLHSQLLYISVGRVLYSQTEEGPALYAGRNHET